MQPTVTLAYYHYRATEGKKRLSRPVDSGAGRGPARITHLPGIGVCFLSFSHLPWFACLHGGMVYEGIPGLW